MGHMLKVVLMILPLVLLSFPYMLASAQSVKSVEAEGSIVSFNGSPHSGLWVAEADFEDGGSMLAVFKSNTDDIFVITIKGVDSVFGSDKSTITGTGFVAKNGVLLKEAAGTATLSETALELKISDDFIVIGKTTSFTKK